MAKQPDDRDPQRKRDDKDATNPHPIEHAHEVDEVLDAEEVQSYPVEETHTARPSPHPTRIAPYQADASDAAPTEAAAEPDKGLAGMPNLSLDEPRQREHDPAGENVLEDEPVLAQSASGASSVVEVAEVVEEDSDVHDVIADEKGQPPRSSSIIEVAELAEIVEDESHHVLSEAQRAPATPVPPMSDDLFVADVVDSQEEHGQETSSIFGKGAAGEVKPASTDSEAHKERAFEEILSAESARKHARTHPQESAEEFVHEKGQVPEVDEDTVDLGSDPEVHMDPSSLQKIKKEKMRAAAEEVTHATEEIDWNDIIEDEESAAAGAGSKEHGEALAAIDAEALEAGDDLEAGEQLHAVKEAEVKDEVIFDDLDSDKDDVPSSKKGTKAARKSEEPEMVFEEETGAAPLKHEEDDVQFDEEEPAIGKAGKASEREEAAKLLSSAEAEAAAEKEMAGGTDQDADELAAHAFLDDDESLVMKKQGDMDDAALAEETEKILPEEVEPVAGKETDKKKGAETEEGELVGAGASKRADKAAATPRSGRRMLVGVCLAALVLVGGAAAVWFAKPDLLEDVSKLSPNYTAPKIQRAKDAPLAVRARAQMDNKQFDQALALLKDADKTPLNLSTRAEARWLKYLQAAGAEKPLDKDAPEVKLVLADLEEAGNDLLKTQVTRALDGGSAKGNAEEMVALQEKLKKTEDAKKDAEKSMVELHEALVKDKYLDGKAKLDPAAFQKILKEFGESKASLAAVNKVLVDAKIQDAGDKGVAQLLTAKKDTDEKLEAFNKLLVDTKFKDEGAKGLAEMIAAQGKLSKERDQLAQAVKAAYQELADAGIVPASDDASGQIVEAVKIARQKAESAANTLKDLTGPATNYLPRAEKLAAQGNLQEALEVLNLGLKALPDNPRLLALRGLVRLEGAHGNRKRIESLQKEIRQDAEKAARDAATAAEGAYVLGLLDESLGNYDRAENDYRKALTAHRGSADEASRYIIALARLLQRDRATGTAPPVPPNDDPPAPQKEKENVQPPEKADPKTDQARLESMRALVALVVATQGVDAGNDKRSPSSARVQESIVLASKLIQSANPKIKGQGHMLMGQAMFKNGKRTEGLKEYVRGLEILYPGDVTRDMFKLLANVPVNQPEAESPRINPVQAEQLFGKGLDLFWS
ncbi:MAG TPA: hypothetical protein VNX28_04935, partial [Gemmataceae bacterium]|nr:hypothetical protein [Gemmataceae bacterium]